MSAEARPPRYLDLILATFVTVLIVSNIASAAKIVAFGGFVFDAGTLLFPLSYIFGDVLTEVYGYKTTRRAIWIGFAMIALMSLTIVVVGALPGEADWQKNVGQNAYDAIFGLTPRIVLGSLLAFWAGSFANAALLARLKTLTQGRWLFLRTIGSTVIGEGVDTLVFCAIAFLGVLPDNVVWTIVVSNYVFKVAVEVLFTPLTYHIVGALKRAEGVDADDAETSLNPFGIAR
jgi:hypothetical protein